MTIDYSIRLLRAARVLAGLSQEEMAQRAGIGRHTLMRLENGDATVGFATVKRIHEILEKAGIEFLPPSNGSGPGMRFREN
ncbi:helix-turn-helix domain-containing protein [Phyllobacterium trifolii]|uniref:helix-turn-helix domain-containing protein n=1 Tax=Phyllobacterium trifolii TaxID=300193 RepID=UPI0035E3F52C